MASNSLPLPRLGILATSSPSLHFQILYPFSTSSPNITIFHKAHIFQIPLLLVRSEQSQPQPVVDEPQSMPQPQTVVIDDDDFDIEIEFPNNDGGDRL